MKRNKPLISIITICYNEPHVLNTCESIISQSFDNYEWIVVDGGSNDKTLNILKQYINKMEVFISEKDNGIYDAMNKGIKKVKGEWIIFMNAGDIFYEKDTLDNIFTDKNYEESIIFGDGINNVYNSKHPLPINKKKKVLKYLFFKNHSFCHQAMFFRKSLFEKYGLYDVSYEIIADHVFNYLLITKGVTYKYLPIIISNIDIEGISAINKKQLLKESAKFKKEMCEINTCIKVYLSKFI